MINEKVNIFFGKLITYSWRYLKCYWSMLLIYFGYKYDKSVIPKDTLYCYTWFERQNKDGRYERNDRICPYYESLNKGKNGCRFLGIIDDCPIFDDMCKCCGENYPDDSEPIDLIK